MLYDDMMLDIAERVPGFGGFFVKEEERVAYVWLRGGDKALLPQVERELRRYYGESLDLANGLRALDAVYDFRELKALQMLAIEHVMAWKDVVRSDVDEMNNRVTIGVSTPEAQQRVLAFARQVGGSDALEVELTAPIENNYQLTDSIRPVGGGLEIRNGTGGCSLGFVAVRAGVLGFVSAAHCTSQQWAYDASSIYQNYSGGFIVDFAPFVRLLEPGRRRATIRGENHRAEASTASSRHTSPFPPRRLELAWRSIQHGRDGGTGWHAQLPAAA